MRFNGSLVAWALLAGLAVTPALQAAAPARKCESLTTLKLPHATIVSAKMIAAGPTTMTTFLGPTRLDVPARCEVRAVSRPSSDSEIGFELWLPLTGWNGKYQQKGNGGFAGTVNRAALVDPLRRGFAVAATDDGHDATKTPQGTFALGHPEKLIDFSYRAVHDTSEQAKAIAAAFYGQTPSTSYFVGCSDGGREALMEAQRYPEDFNGILAGAPANDWSHLFASFAWNELALSKQRIPIEKLPAIQRAVLAACDAGDGVKDGLVSNPLACHFDPAVLACKGADAKDCLSPGQLDTLKALYAGPKSPRTGEQLFPGLLASGSESMPMNWPLWVLGMSAGQSAQAGFAASYFRDVVFERPDWQLRSMDFDRDVRVSDKKVAPTINATNPDLRSFRAHGGKLLQYHGWSDSAIVASSSIQYYQAVRSFLSTAPDPRSPSKSVEDFYRLFMVPGMAHCSGGAGPVHFGNDAADFGTAPASTDPEHDVFSALVRWVEEGVAPDHITGSGPSPLDATKALSRPLCPYPQEARYKGSGDPKDGGNFECAISQK
jgi:feruloyl esterase